jgi:protein phosphatase
LNEGNLTVSSAYVSDVGRVRQINEDYVWVDEKLRVYILADGLGGLQAGEVASRMATTIVAEMIVARLREGGSQSRDEIKQLMVEAIETANQRVHEDDIGAGANGGEMGTVIVVMILCPSVAYVAHSGDSRAYLARDAKLVRLTRDHSLVEELISRGEIRESERRSHPLRNVVTKLIGQKEPVEPSFSEVVIQDGDWLLLCSDGLWEMVEEARILAELQNAAGQPTRATEALVQAANDAGGVDNISVIAIRVTSRNTTRVS